ncbi:MAG: glycosyltransferase family 2 protein [candidate division WOR-3 bacterium]|nr:MAG: glycosyltransferase family 2 protein [candidate division WOR-3 bacterium]
MNSRPMRYSVVIPAYNEAESVGELHREVSEVMAGFRQEYEVIFVDDGSFDDTPTRLADLVRADPHVRVIRFRRNSGKSAAYTVGFEAARGEVVVTLDADLQDDPAELPKLIEGLDPPEPDPGSGTPDSVPADLVVGWKQGRIENEPAKTLPSRFFNSLVHLLFGLRLHDSNSGFRAMRRAVATSLELYGDLYRFIPELAYLRGFRVIEVGVAHRRRKYGRSKYGVKRFWTGVVDLVTVRFITGFTQKPLHFFATVGLFPLVAGIGLEIYVLVRKLLGDHFREHVAALVIGVLLIVVGIQLAATGLVGEMITAQARKRGYEAQELGRN